MSFVPHIDYDHELKVAPAYFGPIDRGEKTFEVRRDDRGFQKGDILWLREYMDAREKYTGNSLHARVEWILTGGQHGIEPGYVVMSISLIDEGDA